MPDRASKMRGEQHPPRIRAPVLLRQARRGDRQSRPTGALVL